MKTYASYIAILIAMLIWSASGIAVKQALLVFPPITMIVLRFTLAVILMLLIGGIACLIEKGINKKRRQKVDSGLALQKVDKKDLPLFLLAGLFQPFLYFIFETYTYRALLSPTLAEALLSTSPLLAPFFAFLILRERVTVYNVVGILVSTAGVLLLLLAGQNDFAIGDTWGILLAVVAVSTAILYTICLKKIPTKYNSLTAVCYIQGGALLLFYPLWLFTERGSALSVICSNIECIWRGALGIGYLAVFSSVMAFIFFCYTVRQLGVTRANAFNNIRPIFTALLMALLFEEQLPLWKWIGIGVIVIGLFISQKTDKKLP